MNEGPKRPLLFVPSSPAIGGAELALGEALRGEGRKKLPPFLSRAYDGAAREVDESFVSDLLLLDPSMLALSLCFWNVDEGLRLAATARALRPGLLIVCGGPQLGNPANASHFLERNDAIDLCFSGEADEGFPELLRLARASGFRKAMDGREAEEREDFLSTMPDIPGMVRRRSERAIGEDLARRSFVKDLSGLPLVYRDENPLLEARWDGRSILPLETLRGCRRICGFCLYAGPLRFFPLDRVQREVAWLCERRAPRVRICDSHFGGTRERALEIFSMIASVNKGSEFSFYPDPGHLDGAYLEAARRAGCVPISLGLESADPLVAARSGRGFDPEELRRSAEAFAQSGMPLRFDLMFGLPGQSPDSFAADLALVKSLGAQSVLASPLMLFPGAWADKEEELGLVRIPGVQGFAYDRQSGKSGYASLLGLARAVRIVDLLPRASGLAAAIARDGRAFYVALLNGLADSPDLDRLSCLLGARSEADKAREGGARRERVNASLPWLLLTLRDLLGAAIGAGAGTAIASGGEYRPPRLDEGLLQRLEETLRRDLEARAAAIGAAWRVGRKKPGPRAHRRRS